jgi:heme-degrading monooxygenase HmoA
MASTTIARVKVQNFETFKSTYDRGEGMRRELRVRGVSLLRDATDPNLVTIITRFDSIADAKAMFASDHLKEAVKSVGVTLQDVFFADVAEEKSY